MSVKEKAAQAKKAATSMCSLSTEIKNNALKGIAILLEKRKEDIFKANRSDLEKAETDCLSPPLLKRLKFQEDKLAEVIEGIHSTAALDDPCNKILSKTILDDGLELFKVSSAIGVIGMIFESRPDALVQIATLCLKSGNSVILKGGREALETNRILCEIIAEAGSSEGLPDGWIQQVESREDVQTMLALDTYIDLLIPRGSNEFVQYIMDNSRIPVLGHADGICHVYVDKDADIDMAVKVVKDSKTQYVAVCNAMETLLVHKDIAREFLPKAAASLEGVELRGCPKTTSILKDIQPAKDEDWSTEYLDYILSIKIVESLEDAVFHINTYGSKHTDAIVTRTKERADLFLDAVDSADLFWNCSTRFADGFKYGLGAEIGISTAKIHARGPVGLEGLVLYKWKLYGNGHVAQDYAGPKGRKFKHIKAEF